MREYLVTVDSEETDPERAESVTCLAFEPTMPSKVASVISSLHMITVSTQFMVGTRRGKIVSCRMSPKQGSSNMILGVFDDMKKSRVLSVDRNPFYPKNFLVIRQVKQSFSISIDVI